MTTVYNVEGFSTVSGSWLERWRRVALEVHPSAAVKVAQAGLRFCAWLYGIVVRLRRFLYVRRILPSVRLPVPIISIGNITVGGTGKTPLVMTCVDICLSLGRRPAVLMRGYKHSPRDRFSDEAELLRRRFPDVPIVEAGDRAAAARQLLAKNPVDVFILDDGFQHLRLQRDLEVVVINSRCPWGTGALLPRGSLREPISTLSHGDVLVFSKRDRSAKPVEAILEERVSFKRRPILVETRMRTTGLRCLRTGQTLPLEHARGKKWVPVCALGDPESFIEQVRGLGVDAEILEKAIVFPDHYVLTEDDKRNIRRRCEKIGAQGLITSAKDAVRWRSFPDDGPSSLEVWICDIEVEFLRGRDEFVQRISHLLRG